MRRGTKIPKTPEDVFRIYGPITPVGLYNRMLEYWRLSHEFPQDKAVKQEFLSLLEANLIMENLK